MVVHDRSQALQHTIAHFSMAVALPQHLKGTHMSRFIEILHRERVIGVTTLGGLLQDTIDKLEADAAHIDIEFPLFVMKRAPVSGVQSLMDYRTTLSGVRRGDQETLSVRVVVPVTSLCPCSKKISERGAHNQRSHVTITARVPSLLALSATPCAWLPAEAQITPFLSCSGLRCAILL